jgi:hypothetical protein
MQAVNVPAGERQYSHLQGVQREEDLPLAPPLPSRKQVQSKWLNKLEAHRPGPEDFWTPGINTGSAPSFRYTI